MEHTKHILKHECKWYVFQEETAQTGTKHLQGTMCLKNRKRLTELKKINQHIHWEPTKSITASIAYCSAVEKRTGELETYGIDLPEEIKIDEPYGWQLKLLSKILEPPNKRTILWYWDRNGNVGKTTFAKYLVVKHKALLTAGKGNDMFHAIAKCKDKPKIVIIDIPRYNIEHINYGAIESIKNGLLYSGKYEGEMCVFNPPHIVVFANQPPDTFKMSEDRWDITEIETD